MNVRRRPMTSLIVSGMAVAALTSVSALPDAWAAPSLNEQAEIIETFRSPNGHKVPYRRGVWRESKPGGGFGYEKVTRKHNIRNNAVLANIVHSPDRARDEGGGRWVHEKIAWHSRCNFLIWDCHIVGHQLVRVVIEYGSWSGPGRMGIVTAYCPNRQLLWPCPDWVNHSA